jgi:outer membrane murein-binding lipoprotein Lpp
MKETAVVGLLLLGCLSCAQPQPQSTDAELAALKSEVAQLRQQVENANRNQVQRWRIEMRQGVRSDIYLLDTATGRVWREYEDKRKGVMWWKESPRDDNPAPIVARTGT